MVADALWIRRIRAMKDARKIQYSQYILIIIHVFIKYIIDLIYIIYLYINLKNANEIFKFKLN